jgi:hypothetical protein
MFQDSERPLYGFMKTYMMVFLSKKFSNLKYFTNFVLINHGLGPDLDPDWIGIQQQVGSGSGFNAYESETLIVMIKTATPWNI